ncbi:MAG TPA: hypothetical protein VGF67_08160 [Ktedonobacteraceae bacterium]|jgi:hypothetical protein
MLRGIVLGYGLLCVIGALGLLFLAHATLWLAVYLIVNGGILVSAVLFEHKRYQRRVDQTRGSWQPTGERFVDPGSGQRMEVFYNRVTGERDYRALPAREET